MYVNTGSVIIENNPIPTDITVTALFRDPCRYAEYIFSIRNGA
jgi:hypothetical protein